MLPANSCSFVDLSTRTLLDPTRKQEGFWWIPEIICYSWDSQTFSFHNMFNMFQTSGAEGEHHIFKKPDSNQICNPIITFQQITPTHWCCEGSVTWLHWASSEQQAEGGERNNCSSAPTTWTVGLKLSLPTRAPAMAETSPAPPAGVAATNSRGRVSTVAS